MYVISEKTGQRYPTIEACTQAEKEFDIQNAEREAKRKAAMAEQEKRQKEIKVAYQEALTAQNNFNKLCTEYLKKYHKNFSIEVPNSVICALFPPIFDLLDDCF